MAILYKANETDFTHFGLGPLNDAVSILVTEERNGIFELEMQYPSDGKVFGELKNDRLIKADAGPLLKNQRFKIIRISKPLKGIVTVYAEHVSYLTQDLALKPRVTFSGTAQQALTAWKNNLVDENPFIVSSDITTSAGGTWTIDKVENPRRALGGVEGSVLDLYGGEYRFDNYQIRLMTQRGVNSAALIAYGRNLTDLTQDEEIANTYTSIYPYATYTENNQDVLVTLPEYFLDSQYAGNFARRKILTVDFSSEEIKTVSALRTRAQQYMVANGIGIPKVNLKIKYLDLSKTLDYKHMAVLETVNLCDNVPIYFEKYGINTTAKVIKVVWDDIQKQYESIEIGESRASLSQAINATVDGKVEKVANQLQVIQLQADGMKLIYRQVEEPPAGSHVGDLWYQPNGIFEIMYQWDGSVWKKILDTGDFDEMSREVKAAQAKAEAAQQAAEQSFTDAVTEVGRMVEAQAQEFSSDLSAQKNALESQITTGYDNAVTAAQNKVDALSQSVTNEIDSRTTTLRQEIAAAESDAIATANAGITALRGTYVGNLADMNAAVSGTKTQADKAVNNINAAVQAAGFTDLSASLTGIKGIANTAQANAQTGIANAATALSNANSALSQLTGVSGKLTTVERNINDLTGQMSLKITSVEAQNIAQAAVDGINIGDRNIIKDSGVRYATTNYSINFYDFSEKPVPGEEYTIVLKGEIDTSINTGFYINIETGITYPAIVILLQSDLISPNLYSKTFIMPELTDYLRLGVYSYPIGLYSMASVDWIKLVKGNRASMDWTPAPEDVEAKVTSLSASLSIESDKIVGLLTRVTNNETVINNVKSTADGTLQTVANQAGKITILETNVNGLNVTVADKASKAELAVVANGVSSTVQSAIDDLEIGGRNYFRKNTPIGQLVPNFSFLNHPEYAPNGFSVVGNSTGSGAIRASNLITGNGWWTVSFDVRGTQSIPVSLFVSICDLGYTKVVTNGNNTFERRSVTVEVTNYGDGSIYNFVDFSNITFAYFIVDNIKVEKGAKATDWTPAPEDMATESRVTQLADNINLRIVEKGNVVAQFNIDNGTTLIQNGKILLDANTYIMGTTFATDIKAKSMEAVNANIGTLRTSILTTDVVTSTMIKTDVATISKLFATDAAVNILTAKTAFIDTVKANALTAVRADIADLRARILTADVITSTHLKVDSATITKLMTGSLLTKALIADTVMTDSMKTNTLSAITANITSVRSQVLVTDVVTATHIKADTALINTIFATDALVTTLTSKTAFINSVKAINISADTVTTGTLNGANVNIINLNVSKLVGNTANFVQVAFNAINNSLVLTADGMMSSNSVGRFVHYTNGGLVFGGGGERTVLRNNTGANPNRSGISLEPVGSNLNAIDLDIATRGTSSFHMGISDLDQGYRLRLSNDDFNTNNYYISLKTGTRFDFRLNSNAASGTNKNNLEIEIVDTSGSLRVGKNAGYGASMYIVGDDVIFAKGGTSNRVPVYASLFAGRAFNYIEGTNVYSVQKTISAILDWIGSAVTWQTA